MCWSFEPLVGGVIFVFPFVFGFFLQTRWCYKVNLASLRPVIDAASLVKM